MEALNKSRIESFIKYCFRVRSLLRCKTLIQFVTANFFDFLNLSGKNSYRDWDNNFDPFEKSYCYVAANFLEFLLFVWLNLEESLQRLRQRILAEIDSICLYLWLPWDDNCNSHQGKRSSGELQISEVLESCKLLCVAANFWDSRILKSYCNPLNGKRRSGKPMARMKPTTVTMPDPPPLSDARENRRQIHESICHLNDSLSTRAFSNMSKNQNPHLVIAKDYNSHLVMY